MGTYSKDLLVCLLPRISMIKQNNNNVNTNVRDLTYNHSFKKFCMKNTLTNHEECSSNPSCKPSNERNTITCQENPPKQELRLPSKSQNTKTKDKSRSLTREWVVLCLKWEAMSSLYIIQMTLNYKNRSLKQPTRLTNNGYIICHIKC